MRLNLLCRKKNDPNVLSSQFYDYLCAQIVFIWPFPFMSKTPKCLL